MDGPNLIVQQTQQEHQHLGSYSNHNTSYLQQAYDQTNPQPGRDNNSASNSGQFEQYDRLTSNASLDTSQHVACDINLGTTNNDFEFNEEHCNSMTEPHLNSTDNHHQQSFLPVNQNDEQDKQNQLQAGDCDIHQTMDEDDAFIAFCADSSSVLNNDSNRIYHINKLYQPLTNGSGIHHRNTDHDHQHQMEQDDEYMLYQELRFIESSAQQMSNGRERTELSKILDDDDCDDIAGRRDDVDPLDCLNLTNIIDSFVDFGDAPLIDTCNGETDPLMSETCSQESESPVKPDSSGLGNEYSPSGHINSTTEYTQEISSNSQYNSINTNHQYQDIFSQQHADSCYNPIPSDSFAFDQNDQTRINQIPSHDEHYAQPRHHEAGHQDMTREIDSCIRILSDPVPTAEQNMDPTITSVETSASIKRVTKATNKRKSSNTDTSVEVQPQKAGARKLKKRRSTPATKKSQSVLSAIKARDDEQTRSHAQKAEHIKELTTRLLNDEDESMISDNSIRSDGSKRNPVINHYRRRTANARERIRMREINQAFEKLKKVVPAELIRQAIQESEEMSDQGAGRRKSPSGGKSCDQQSDSTKLTKITTLRLAVSYIGKLSEILSQCPENPPVKLIPKSEESFDLSDNLTKAAQKAREDKKSKTDRRSRTTTKKGPRVTKERQVQKGGSRPKATPDQLSETNQLTSSRQIERNDQISRDQQKPVMVKKSQNSGDPIQTQQQPSSQTIQTAFISIPNQPKPQYLSAYPNQQPMLISQQMTGSAERQLVTPVTVAILGIPSNSGHGTGNPSNARGLQILSLQNTQQGAVPMVHQQPTYNLQFSQPQPQNRTPQQVTLTLDDLNGLSVLRLANPQLQNQSVPIQIKTTSNQFLQSHQPTQIFTASNGLNYAFRPMPSVQQSNNTNLITSLSSPITTPSNYLQVCNANNNLMTQNISNSNMSNNIIPTTIINNNSSIISGHQQSMEFNGQILCNINQSSQTPNSTATTSTGNLSEQQTGASTISSCGQTSDRNKVFQISQQPMSNVQQQNAVFVPNNNLMSISTSTSSNQSFQSQSIPIVSHTGHRLDQDHQEKANVVYISHMGTATNVQQPQICLVAQGQQRPQEQACTANEITGESAKQQQPIRGSGANKLATQNKMEYITHFGIQARSQDKDTPSETNINKLVASLATSIQPAVQAKNPIGSSRTKTSSESRKSQQQQQQQQQNQQQQQAVRTYRFHNYDGDMINSHLYGSNNSDRQQTNHSQKRTQAIKQLQDNMNRMAEQPAASHRSRQNSLSSICSTVSCSSSSPNSTSSTSGSPANHSFAVMKSPKSDGGNRSGSNSSPILLDEVRAG